MFLVMKPKKNIQSMCQKILSRDVNLILIGKVGKRHYVPIKKFNHTLHRGRKHFCLQAFSTVEILASHVNDWFKINIKRMIKIPKKVNMLDSKMMEGK